MSDRTRALATQVVAVMAIAFVDGLLVQGLGWDDTTPRIAPQWAMPDRWIGLAWLLAFALFGTARGALLDAPLPRRGTLRLLDLAILTCAAFPFYALLRDDLRTGLIGTALAIAASLAALAGALRARSALAAAALALVLPWLGYCAWIIAETRRLNP